jgi:glycerol-3-phosphate acyltransferase PlsY
MLELGLKTLLSYLLGSLMGALIVGRLRGVDIRTMGSGNAGGTNALRTQGLAFAIGVVVIDVGKGWLAAAVVPGWSIPGVGPDGQVSRDWLAVCCGFAAIAGHVWPVWYDFRGGKGGATMVGVLLALAPLLLVPAIGSWFVVVMLTGYVGLGTMAAAVSVPVAIALSADRPLALLVFAAVVAIFVIWAHRSNIARIRAGTEARARRLWLLRPRGPE